VLVPLLALSDLLLAVSVFVLFARQDQAIALAARASGVWETWLQGGLGDPEIARLDGLATRLRRGLLALLFAWSFLVGAALGLSRL
jgi:hypothetical protein